MARKRTARRRRVASKRRSAYGGSRRKSARRRVSRRRTSRRRVLRGGTEMVRTDSDPVESPSSPKNRFVAAVTQEIQSIAGEEEKRLRAEEIAMRMKREEGDEIYDDWETWYDTSFLEGISSDVFGNSVEEAASADAAAVTPDTRNRKGKEIPSTGEKTNQYTQRYGYGVPMRESPPPAGTSTDSSANAAQAATIAGSLCAEADASDSQRKNARSNIIEYNKLNPNTPICDQVVEDNTGERMLDPSLIHHPNAHACAHSPPIRP